MDNFDRQDLVELVEIARGAMAEAWRVGELKVLENLLDPNTDRKAPRRQRIEAIYVAKDDERNEIAVRLRSSVKLADDSEIRTTIYAGRIGGKIVAREHNPTQMLLDAYGSDDASRAGAADTEGAPRESAPPSAEEVE